MASELSQTLQALAGRMELLERKCAGLEAQLRAKDEAIASLTHDNSQLASRIATLESDEKFLRISYRMAQTPDDIVTARKVISSLIRNIDKCIADLKE